MNEYVFSGETTVSMKGVGVGDLMGKGIPGELG